MYRSAGFSEPLYECIIIVQLCHQTGGRGGAHRHGEHKAIGGKEVLFFVLAEQQAGWLAGIHIEQQHMNSALGKIFVCGSEHIGSLPGVVGFYFVADVDEGYGGMLHQYALCDGQRGIVEAEVGKEGDAAH